MPVEPAQYILPEKIRTPIVSIFRMGIFFHSSVLYFKVGSLLRNPSLVRLIVDKQSRIVVLSKAQL